DPVHRHARGVGRVGQLEVALHRLGGGEHLHRGPGAGQRLAHRLRPLREEAPLTLPERAFGEPTSRLDPGGADAGELVARRHAIAFGAQAAACCRAESGSAFFAVSTREAKAAWSFTASSASMRRSTSMPAALRPCM